jgi:hypothetical protein
MTDYQSGIKVVDQVLLIKKINTVGTAIVADEPDSDEAILYIDSDGALKFKNQNGTFTISAGL